MDDLSEGIKNIAAAFRKTVKQFAKRLIIPSTAIIIIFLIIVFSWYSITRNDATYKEGDKSNILNAVHNHKENVNININGNIETSITTQELWDQMLKDRSRVDEYLKSPEELLKLMNAELVTEYLDTRENPDEEINWDSINRDVNSKVIQGIIKLKRAQSNGSTKTLTYVSPETMEMYIDNYNETGSKVDKENALSHFTLEKGYAPSNSGSGENYTSEKDEVAKNIENNDGNNDETEATAMCWPAEGTGITSLFGESTNPTTGKRRTHRGIDIAPISENSNIYAAESGTVFGAGYDAGGGNMLIIDHGNGYMTKYMHNNQILVSKGQTVTKGQVIALAGSTGNSKETHLHFQIERNGVAVDPLSFKYENGMGDGTAGIGVGSDNSDDSTGEGESGSIILYAKVATWDETTEIMNSDDPEVENKNKTTYNMTTTQIDYKKFVERVEMPFDYLWALLVISQDKDFVFRLADLVYSSEIEITVHDNLSEVTNSTQDTYTKATKVVTDDVRVMVEYKQKDSEQTSKIVEEGGPFEDEEKETFTASTTVITKINTLNTALTKANTWIANYSQEFTYQPAGEGQMSGPTEIQNEDEEYPETPDKTDLIDALGLAEEYRKSVQETYSQDYESVITKTIGLNSKYYYKMIDSSQTISCLTKNSKYISNPPKTIEKTDKDAKEPNFVTIFLDCGKAKSNILSATGVLFEILEEGPNTVDKVDLTKYLLYKATGKDYGVKEYNIQIVDLSAINKIRGGNLENYIKAWENSELWLYETGQSSKFPSNYLSSDENYYIVYEDRKFRTQQYCIWFNNIYIKQKQCEDNSSRIWRRILQLAE